MVAFLSASGGVGKTTIAAHLAHKFLSEGKKVLLIDLDPSAGLSTALLGETGVAELEEKKRTVGDAPLKFLRGESVELVDYVTATNKLGIYRVDLVPSGDSLSDAMGLAWFSGSRPSPERLLRLLGEIRRLELGRGDTRYVALLREALYTHGVLRC